MEAVDASLALPPVDAARALVRLPESQWFERKSGRIAARDLAVTLVAFANAEGGTVVVGLSQGGVDGVGQTHLNTLRQTAMDHTMPPVRARAREIHVPGDGGNPKTLLVLHVEPGDQLHTRTNGDCYLRVGDESRKLNFAQRQELSFDRGSAPFDGTPADLALPDLDQEQVRSYTRALGAGSVQGMLAARDLVDRRGRLTVAACLLFAARPQREWPNAHVRILRYGSTERGTGHSLSLEEATDVRVEGSIPHQIRDAAVQVERLVPRWRRLAESGLFEPTPLIPRDAWLEGLVNAVVHRSYSMVGDHIRMEIFPNRIEVTSPGRFPGIVDPARPLDISRFARNPRIARVCSDLGITAELGEGIKRIFAEMRRRGLVDPVYTQSASSVRLTLMARDAIPEEVLSRLTSSGRTILDVLRVADRPMGTGEIADLAGVTRMTATRALAVLREEGLVLWEGRSAKDPRAAWRLP